jgi:hypothetical protein
MRLERDGWSVEQGLKKGRPAPSWYLERPPEGLTDEFYRAAFNDLGTERSIGMSLGPIPWSKIVAYAEFVGLDWPNTYAFVEIIRKMDRAWMEDQAEKLPDPAKSKRDERVRQPVSGGDDHGRP